MSRTKGLGLVIFVVAAMVVIAATTMLTIGGSAALFTAHNAVQGDVGAGRIFPDSRTTTAFDVTDRSGGSSVDASNPIAFAGDGLALTSSAWPAAFDSGRYLAIRLNGPLPAALANSSASFQLTWGGGSAGSSACFFIEIRDGTSGAVLETVGSESTPLECVSGTSQTTTSTPLGSLATTDLANGLVVRVYGRDAAGAGFVVDRATLSGDYGLATYTLYPIEMVDLADGSAGTFGWGPAGP